MKKKRDMFIFNISGPHIKNQATIIDNLFLSSSSYSSFISHNKIELLFSLISYKNTKQKEQQEWRLQEQPRNAWLVTKPFISSTS